MAQAEAGGRKVTGLTISDQQFGYVRERAGRNTDVRLLDYRRSDGRYPAVVSIEMLEAVGEKYWPRYFLTLKDRLDDGGIAMVQTITIREPLFRSYRTCSDFIREHIFPGGMLSTVPRIVREAERAGLTVGDIRTRLEPTMRARSGSGCGASMLRRHPSPPSATRRAFAAVGASILPCAPPRSPSDALTCIRSN